ncbi:MAG: acyltransferase [Lysobacteraceae bacterium]|nr:MAG: acyltransferase [Xanthomonadaceae bacterium]
MDAGILRGADCARSVACLAVFTHHISLASGHLALSPLLRSVVDLAERGKLGVSIFFVLSGFLLSIPFWRACDRQNSVDLRTYALRRASRILPATWVCLIVSFGVDLAYAGSLEDGKLVRLITGLLFVSDFHWFTLFPVVQNGPLWSLSFEVSSYLMMPLAFIALRQAFPGSMVGWTARYLWVLVLLLALAAHGLVMGLVETPVSSPDDVYAVAKDWFPRYNPMAFFVMFAIGTLAAGVHTQIALSTTHTGLVKGLGIMVIGVLVPALAYTVLARPFGFEPPPFGFPMLPLATGLFLILCQKIPASRWLDGPVMAFVAKISFGIYIWHALLITALGDALRSLHLDPVVSLTLLAGGSLSGAVLIATVSYTYFEEPMIFWARRLERRRQSLPNADTAAPEALA